MVIPLWLAAPVVAALSWGPLDEGRRATAALIVGVLVGAAVALLFFRAVAFPDCEFGAVRGPTDWILPSALLGVVIGAGLAVGGLVASGPASEDRLRAAILRGAGVQLVAGLLALGIAFLWVGAAGCQPPHA